MTFPAGVGRAHVQRTGMIHLRRSSVHLPVSFAADPLSIAASDRWWILFEAFRQWKEVYRSQLASRLTAELVQLLAKTSLLRRAFRMMKQQVPEASAVTVRDAEIVQTGLKQRRLRFQAGLYYLSNSLSSIERSCIKRYFDQWKGEYIDEERVYREESFTCCRVVEWLTRRRQARTALHQWKQVFAETSASTHESICRGAATKPLQVKFTRWKLQLSSQQEGERMKVMVPGGVARWRSYSAKLVLLHAKKKRLCAFAFSRLKRETQRQRSISNFYQIITEKHKLDALRRSFGFWRHTWILGLHDSPSHLAMHCHQRSKACAIKVVVVRNRVVVSEDEHLSQESLQMALNILQLITDRYSLRCAWSAWRKHDQAMVALHRALDTLRRSARYTKAKAHFSTVLSSKVLQSWAKEAKAGSHAKRQALRSALCAWQRRLAMSRVQWKLAASFYSSQLVTRCFLSWQCAPMLAQVSTNIIHLHLYHSRLMMPYRKSIKLQRIT